MDIKKILKRILGYAVVVNIIPMICISIQIARTNSASSSNLIIPYLAGCLIDLTVISIYYLFKFLEWCFD